jgi:signal peptidase I
VSRGRIVRLAIVAGLLGAVWWLLHGLEKFEIPDGDPSLEPRFERGSTVVARTLAADAPLRRGDDVVYAMEHEGKRYARFGRVRALPGDAVGSNDGRLTVNGELVGPIPMPGEAMGRVPEGFVLILAVGPSRTQYKDSRENGFVARTDVRGVILFGW